jgi:hypothetical protein
MPMLDCYTSRQLRNKQEAVFVMDFWCLKRVPLRVNYTAS